MVVLGIFIGAILGALFAGVAGAVAGAFVGFIVAMALRPAGVRAPLAPASRPEPGDAILRRLDAIEARLARLESRVGVQVPVRVPGAGELGEAVVAAPAGIATAADSPVAPVALPPVAPASVPSTAPEQADLGEFSGGTVAARRDAAGHAPNRLWAWLVGGNALARIGVVVLFFGVAFLLKDVVNFSTLPIGMKLAAVAAAGGVFIALGLRLAGARPGYGLSLQGAGAGILYLTVFAAFRIYDVLPPLPAFALLVAVAVLTTALALRGDSQALAGLAVAGGFLAPMLVGTDAGAPARLFGYFAVLNTAILALAWRRAWRALNALGFVFTFVLGLHWGEQYYRPEYFATVEPFLIVFFLFYVGIAVLHAARGASTARAPVDALLAFGVPLVTFALQSRLVADVDNAVTWSALALAVFYALLAAVLYRRTQSGLVQLAKAFVAIAIVFATSAIAFGAEARWTSAWWALEAAAVYWIGSVQKQTLVRVFALLLQVGAAVAFAWGEFELEPRAFLNATYVGTLLIAVAGFATAFVAERYRDDVTGMERNLLPLLLLWSLVWWYGGAAKELMRTLSPQAAPNAMLAFAIATTVVAILLRRWLRWPRIAWVGAALLPAMLVAGALDWSVARTTLLSAGWLVWPLAWMAHWSALHALEQSWRVPLGNGQRVAAESGARSRPGLRNAHALSAIVLVCWAVWEASEWTGRAMPRGTVWMACAAAWPAIAYLAAMTRSSTWNRWPFDHFKDAYAVSAATTVAAFLGVWFATANVSSPGDVDPLPYLPLANALDMTLIAALAALFVWARRILDVGDRPLYGGWGLAVFLLINAVVFRTVHQWLDVAWSMPKLLASRPLQAALTLTWTATALPLMLFASRRAIRPLWMVGAGLLVVVVGKLFLVDLAALSGLTRVVAFLGVGMLLLLIGYLSPLPPVSRGER